MRHKISVTGVGLRPGALDTLRAVDSAFDPFVHTDAAILERVLGNLIEVGPDLRWCCCARSRAPARRRRTGAALPSTGVG